MTATLNVLGGVLESCCHEPTTGFYRDGTCRTGEDDRGAHIICALMTKEFLTFSKARGNDLSTPKPEFGFEGLKPGDKWCLCAARWVEAEEAGHAPPVVLASTHANMLELVELGTLLRYADAGVEQ